MLRFRLLLALLLCFHLAGTSVDALDRSLLEGLPMQVVDGVDCTLPDAILAANAASAVGGCLGAPGLEILSLEADVLLTEAHPLSSVVGGASAGLPDVTSGIVITSGAGSLIERDPMLPCGPTEATAFRLFNVVGGGALYLIDLDLRGGCVAPASGVSAQGGAIHLRDGLLELSGVLLENHQVHGLGAGEFGAVGGALLCVGATVSAISGSTFRSNLARGADNQGADTSAAGGAGIFDECTLGELTQTVFDSNSAIASSFVDGRGQGGALFLLDSSLDQALGSSFLDNLAQGGDTNQGSSGLGSGGALFVQDSAITTMSGGTFSGNRAVGGDNSQGSGNFGAGGAILLTGLESSIQSLVGSVFEGNTAVGGDAGDTSSPGAGGGGAIDMSSNAFIGLIQGSLFRDNAARGGQKTGVGGGGADGDGGSIRLCNNCTIGQIERTTFWGNEGIGGAASSAAADGGAILVEGAVQRIVHSTFVGNRAVGGTDNDPDDPGGRGRGGAISVIASGEIGEITASTFVDNEAQGGSGGIGSGEGLGGGIWTEAPVLGVGGNLFSGNLSRLDDGTATAEDCHEEAPNLVSVGWNQAQAPGTCVFASTGDQTGLATITYAPAEWGCSESLPDGSCVPTVAIDQESAAVEQSSCAELGIAIDARGIARPFNLEAVANADDGCDIGAFEALDADGDGFTEAADCAPGDPNRAIVDRCGVCGGDGLTCLVFEDGFESGNTSAWSARL